MSEDLYPRAKAIVLQLAALSPLDRETEALTLCGADRALLLEVLELLAFESRAALDPFGAVLLPIDPDESDAYVGRELGKYRIESKLGAGGMGIVFAARQEHPKRSVALKLLRGQILSERALRRFEHEVEVLGRLSHPNIAHVYEAGINEIDGAPTPYFAMELVRDAEPIDRYCRQRALSRKEVLSLFLQACDALDHGHAAGVVHRDVKPGNVLVDAGRRVKVIDFGIARATDIDLSRTVSSSYALEGTLAYMSPEQCDGDRARLGAQIDVYALGVVLYELLCGSAPYDLDGLSLPAAISVIREREPDPPSRRNRALRGDLDAIVQKCLEKDPKRRYSSAGALATDLRRFLTGESIEARAPSRWRRVTRWAARHPWSTIGAASVTILLVVAGAFWVDKELNGRAPARTDVVGSFVRLLSRDDEVLASWHVGVVPQVVSHQVLKVPQTAASGALVVIAVDANAVGSSWAGKICAFDSDRPETPLWSSDDHPLELPDGKVLRAEVQFSPTLCQYHEIFESSPGPELVAVHRERPFSSCAVRVYGIDGALLYEAWHEGTLNSLLWDPMERSIVIAGVDGEAMWSGRGVDLGADGPRYPFVVAALEPALRARSDRAIVRSGERRDETLRWIKWLGPPRVAAELGEFVPRLELLGDGGGSAIQLMCLAPATERRPARADLWVRLSPAGETVSIFAGDHFRLCVENGWLSNAGSFAMFDYSELPSIR